MSSAPIHRDSTTRVQSAVRRGAPSSGIGSRKVTTSQVASGVEASDEWVVIEAEADIAAKAHPYLSFDPDGTYPPP